MGKKLGINSIIFFFNLSTFAFNRGLKQFPGKTVSFFASIVYQLPVFYERSANLSISDYYLKTIHTFYRLPLKYWFFSRARIMNI